MKKIKTTIVNSIGYLVGTQICLLIPRLGNDVHQLFQSSKYRLTDEEQVELNECNKTRPWNEYITELNKYREKYLPKEVFYYSHHLGILHNLFQKIKKDPESFIEGVVSACWDDDFFEYSNPTIQFEEDYFTIKFTLDKVKTQTEV